MSALVHFGDTFLTKVKVVQNDKFSIPPWKKLMQYRVVVCSCLDASILVTAQCTNSKLMTMEEEVIASLHPNRKQKHVVQPHWTHLLIDEVSFLSVID